MGYYWGKGFGSMRNPNTFHLRQSIEEHLKDIIKLRIEGGTHFRKIKKSNVNYQKPSMAERQTAN